MVNKRKNKLKKDKKKIIGDNFKFEKKFPIKYTYTFIGELGNFQIYYCDKNNHYRLTMFDKFLGHCVLSRKFSRLDSAKRFIINHFNYTYDELRSFDLD